MAPYEEFHSDKESHVYLVITVVTTVSVHVSEGLPKRGSFSFISLMLNLVNFNLEYRFKHLYLITYKSAISCRFICRHIAKD